MNRNESAENGSQLELDTAAYFQHLSKRAAREESRLVLTLSWCACEIDFDEVEPVTGTDPTA